MVDSTPGIVLGSISAAGFALFCLWVRRRLLMLHCRSAECMRACTEALRPLLCSAWSLALCCCRNGPQPSSACATAALLCTLLNPRLPYRRRADVRLLSAAQNHPSCAP